MHPDVYLCGGVSVVIGVSAPSFDNTYTWLLPDFTNVFGNYSITAAEPGNYWLLHAQGASLHHLSGRTTTGEYAHHPARPTHPERLRSGQRASVLDATTLQLDLDRW